MTKYLTQHSKSIKITSILFIMTSLLLTPSLSLKYKCLVDNCAICPSSNTLSCSYCKNGYYLRTFSGDKIYNDCWSSIYLFWFILFVYLFIVLACLSFFAFYSLGVYNRSAGEKQRIREKIIAKRERRILSKEPTPYSQNRYYNNGMNPFPQEAKSPYNIGQNVTPERSSPAPIGYNFNPTPPNGQGTTYPGIQTGTRDNNAMPLDLLPQNNSSMVIGGNNFRNQSIDNPLSSNMNYKQQSKYNGSNGIIQRDFYNN